MTGPYEVSHKPLQGVVCSDFNAANFCGCLNQNGDGPAVAIAPGPAGSVAAQLMAVGDGAFDFAVVWTRPEAVVPAFAQALAYQLTDEHAALSEVRRFADQVLTLQDRVAHIFVPSWTMPIQHRGWGFLDMRPGVGMRHLLLRMNQELTEALQAASNIYVLDAQTWMAVGGPAAFQPKLWYLGKIPFGTAVFAEAACDIKAALRGVGGMARKLVLLDLDNTLWGGEVGEVGPEGLRLGGHDALGEAFADFQRALKGLTRRGIVLGILSKNDERTALGALARHPEMVLRMDDFAGWRINWQDKAENAIALAAELNLSLSSAVFIDDQAAERARIREALPEVLVPEWPTDPMRYVQALQGLRCFDTPSVSAEDRQRATMYASDRKRRTERQMAVSFDDWLQRLDTRMTVTKFESGEAQRAAQLLNRVNQMNLCTRRLSEAELIAWMAADHRHMWLFRVSDVFGDAGICGLVGLSVCDGVGELTDFVLSCRVMGRQVEAAMLHATSRFAAALGVAELRAVYVPTPRNAPCLDLFAKSGFERQDDTFVWRRGIYEKPRFIDLNFGDADA